MNEGGLAESGDHDDGNARSAATLEARLPEVQEAIQSPTRPRPSLDPSSPASRTDDWRQRSNASSPSAAAMRSALRAQEAPGLRSRNNSSDSLASRVSFLDDEASLGPESARLHQTVVTLRDEVRIMQKRIDELEGAASSPAEPEERGPGNSRSKSALRGSKAKSTASVATRSSRASRARSDSSDPTMRASVKRINEDVQGIMRESQRRSRGKKDGSATHVNGCGEWDNGHPSEFCEAPIDGLTETQARELLKKWGKNELVEKVVPKWLVFLRLLSGPMPIMLWIAAAIECAIANYLDMCILLFIQFANTSISFYETTKAGDAVAALKASLKPKATAKRDGKWAEIDATLLVPGDRVLLAAGSAIPADVFVNDGVIEVDQSAMTGESLPVEFRRGDVCKLGSSVVRGETEGTVESTGTHTFFGKTASMLQSVDNAAGSLQVLLMRIMVILVSLSLALCAIVLVYLIIRGREQNSLRPEMSQRSDDKIIKESLSFVIVLLVASIPLAIEIVTTTTLALGSKALSAKGAIVTRLSSIEDLAGMDMLCSDKTGTLTLNKMMIQKEEGDCPIYTPGESYDSILFQAALAAKWKEPPRDALDTMILSTSGQDLSRCDAYEQLDFTPFDPRSKRTEAQLKGPDGKIFRVTKGAPHVILGMCHNKADIELLVESKVTELGSRGVRSLALARMDDEDGQWRMLGILTFLDPPRPDTEETIRRCKDYGVGVKMITGDHLVIAKETSRVLGMGIGIHAVDGLPVLQEDGGIPDDLLEKYGQMIVPADGFASVFPEHKYLIVETLRRAGFRVGMTGDGVNDAPALKRADVGIAVQGATDAARAAADLVLTDEGLSTIVDGIEISREIFARLKNFISYRIAATLQLLVFFFLAVIFFSPESYYKANGFENAPGSEYINIPRQSKFCPSGFLREDNRFAQIGLNYDELQAAETGCSNIILPICSEEETGACEAWPAFFQMPVLMLMLITLLNDGALISVGYDVVAPSAHPEHWNLGRLFLVATVMAGAATGSSLLLLDAALDSNNPEGLFASLGIPPVEYGTIITMMYLKVALSDFLTLFSCRTQGQPFWSLRPGKPLMFAICLSITISTVLALWWPEGSLDGLPVKGLAVSGYTWMAVWIWTYCIAWWVVQDALKVFVVWALSKYDILPDPRPELPSRQKMQEVGDYADA